jgi:predicted RNA-binding Zn ribbon-like protein
VFTLQNKDRLDYQTIVGRLNEILRTYGEQNPEVTYADLDDLKVVSRKLYAVFVAQDTQQAAALLNELLTEHAYAPRLSCHNGTPWHIHVDSNDHAPWSEWFAASSALALATLLAEKQRNPGGVCAAADCGRPFIDLGKGGGRRYCSPRCATRERVAAYRRQH